MQRKASDSNAERRKAENILSIYHEDASMEAKLLRKELYFQIMVLIHTSPWWLAIKEDIRANIVDMLVRLNEQDDALDILYGDEYVMMDEEE